jgi:hypothetical protein
MNAMGQPLTKKQRAQIAALETSRRRRTEELRALAAIGREILREHDERGFAKGLLSVIDLAASAQVSKKSAARSLSHWRNQRVLWLAWKGHRTWEVRFEREVIDKVLSLPPREIGRYLVEHKRRREMTAPRSCISA